MGEMMDKSIITDAACCGFCKYAVQSTVRHGGLCCNIGNSRPPVICAEEWEDQNEVYNTKVCPFFEVNNAK